jgi:hypothetical protein
LRFAILSILFLALPAAAEEAICYSAKSAFATSAPSGWVADHEAAKKLGLCAIYHPAGYSYDSSPVVIYPNLVEASKRLPNGRLDLQDFIDGDVETFQGKNKSLRAVILRNTIALSGLEFARREFLGGRAPNEFEEVAYLAAEDAVFLGVHSARSRADYERYQPAFAEFLGNIVKVPRESLQPSKLESYSVLKQRSDEDEAMQPGKTFEVTFMRGIVKDLGSFMAACTKKGDLGFRVVLVVSAEGRVQEVVFEDLDATAGCLRTKMAGLVGPKPPFAPFHLFLDMRIKP